MESLDPRINRLEIKEARSGEIQIDTMDQLETYEVFVQPREGKPFGHEGIVHASDEEIAFVFAKEQYSRRGTCVAIMIIKTQKIYTSDFSEAEVSIYDSIVPATNVPDTSILSFEVFHLLRRGKQHVHVGSVEALNPEDAIYQAKKTMDPGKPVYNVWIVESDNVFQTETEDPNIWETLSEKTFREAIDYRGAEKIKKFKEEQARNEQGSN